MLNALPRTHNDIVTRLRTRVESIGPRFDRARVDTLAPGQVFAPGEIGQSFGFDRDHSERVDEVLLRLDIVAETEQGDIVVAPLCLQVLRQVLETACVLYSAVLDQCLRRDDCRKVFYRCATDLIMQIDEAGVGVPGATKEFATFLDTLEERCENAHMRALLGDVRLQLDFLARRGLTAVSGTSSSRGLAIMLDGIRDNDPMIAAEGLHFAWRSFDDELARAQREPGRLGSGERAPEVAAPRAFGARLRTPCEGRRA